MKIKIDKKILSLMTLLLMPTIVLAETNSYEIVFAFAMEFFMTFLWYPIAFLPLAELIFKDKKPKAIAIIVSIIRVVLLFCITPVFSYVYFVDFLLFMIVFGPVGAIVTLINEFKKHPPVTLATSDPVIVQTPTGTITCPKCNRVMAYGNTRCVVCGTDLRNVAYRCTKCNAENQPSAKFCTSCGAAMMQTDVTAASQLELPKCPKCNNELVEGAKFCAVCGENVEATMADRKSLPSLPRANEGTQIDKTGFDKILLEGGEDDAIAFYVEQELSKNPSYRGKTLQTIENRKTLTTILYAVITFLLVSIFMFYHTNGSSLAIIWLVATIIWIVISKKYNLKKYLINEIKKRPDEKINYIISSTLSGAKSNKFLFQMIRVATIVLCVVWIFKFYSEPHLIYEKQKGGGYEVRYHTYGIKSTDEIIVIPEEYKGEKVIGIRGDTFKNEYFLREVVLPETITEIRGGAFQGCSSLEKINLPKGITEIHGSTFEDCTSLTSIDIPEGVTRIGGSAFRNCMNLREATIPESVEEIGSSAFRGTSLSSVCISANAYVNERAFKETYAEITYYEYGCKSTGGASYDYGY